MKKDSCIHEWKRDKKLLTVLHVLHIKAVKICYNSYKVKRILNLFFFSGAAVEVERLWANSLRFNTFHF